LQKKLNELFRTILQNSNLIGITDEDSEVFTSKDIKVFIADFQTENNRQGILETLCNHVQEKLHLLQRFFPDTFSNIIKWCISHADLHHFAHQSDSNRNAF
jgi:hypothetical protein